MNEEWFEHLLDETGEDDRTLDEIFDLLSDRYVRHSLYYLFDRTSTSLDELADLVAGLEAVESDAITTPEDHERIRVRLYHVVLPKLDAHGYVEFDTDEHSVTRTEVPATVHSLLDAVGYR